jgi:hypothetical protein
MKSAPSSCPRDGTLPLGPSFSTCSLRSCWLAARSSSPSGSSAAAKGSTEPLKAEAEPDGALNARPGMHAPDSSAGRAREVFADTAVGGKDQRNPP